MKHPALPALFTLFALALATLPCVRAQDAEAAPARQPLKAAPSEDQSGDELSQATNPEITGWGRATDPDHDCRFFLSSGGALLVSVPASARPHDFSPELGTTNAPRVLQSAPGDFTFQVTVDDRHKVGDQSTQPGRVNYQGAGIVALADERNAVTFARAVMSGRGGEMTGYGNFELRVNGDFVRAGKVGDCPLPLTGPVILKLERRGREMTASASTDGKEWLTVDTVKLPEDWQPGLQVGVMVVNTSPEDFGPRFSKLQFTK